MLTPKQRRERNRDILLWLVVGLVGVACAPRPEFFAVSYGVGTGCYLVLSHKGWL